VKKYYCKLSQLDSLIDFIKNGNFFYILILSFILYTVYYRKSKVAL